MKPLHGYEGCRIPLGLNNGGKAQEYVVVPQPEEGRTFTASQQCSRWQTVGRRALGTALFDAPCAHRDIDWVLGASLSEESTGDRCAKLLLDQGVSMALRFWWCRLNTSKSGAFKACSLET